MLKIDFILNQTKMTSQKLRHETDCSNKKTPYFNYYDLKLVRLFIRGKMITFLFYNIFKTSEKENTRMKLFQVGYYVGNLH